MTPTSVERELDEATAVTVAGSDCQQWCGQSRRDEEAEDFDMAECVRQVRRRDEDAARRFMERLYPLVVKVVRAHLPRRTSEEDLVQTVFMKVFAHLDQYQGKVPLEHWVSRIAVNTSLNALKAEKSRPELRWSDLSDETQYLFESLASEESEGWETQGMAARDLLRQLMERLSPADRLVVTLLHLEEKSVAEVRAITGWGAALVKVRAFRARKKLQKFLRQLEERQ